MAYATLITRRYRKDPAAFKLAEALKTLSDAVEDALSTATKARGAHMHQERFDDEELSHLTWFEVLASGGDSNLRLIYEHRYRKTRETQAIWIRDTNRAIEALVDRYFQVLNRFLLTKKRGFRGPGEAALATG